MLIGYKTDPNGNPMPETIVVDAKIAQTLSALKNQEQGKWQKRIFSIQEIQH